MQERARTVLVTGASRGLGRGIALELAAAGYNVAINYRSNRDAAEKTATECARLAAGDNPKDGRNPKDDDHPKGAPRFLPIQADVAIREDRERLVAETLTAFGSIHALVNNAGMAPRDRTDITEASEESFEELLRTNLQGPYFLTQAVVRHWLAITGSAAPSAAGPNSAVAAPGAAPGAAPRSIVFITSISAATASISRGEYCVSKAGLAMAAQLWATRLAAEGIGVYEVRPGIMATDMTAGVREKYDALIAEGLVPQRRWGTPEDVGRAVRALVDGDLAYSTGAVIYSDGGFHLSQL